MIIKICTKCGVPKKLSEFHKDKDKDYGVSSRCKLCRRQIQKEHRKKYPWKHTLAHIKQRCKNANSKGFSNYGGRGIECRITENEVKELWFRDKGYLMNKPTIDRKDNNGNYEFGNCRFIEKSVNSKKRNKDNPQGITILQYDLQGNFIKEWASALGAEKELGIARQNIGSCCKGKLNTSGGFVWRFR